MSLPCFLTATCKSGNIEFTISHDSNMDGVGGYFTSDSEAHKYRQALDNEELVQHIDVALEDESDKNTLLEAKCFCVEVFKHKTAIITDNVSKTLLSLENDYSTLPVEDPDNLDSKQKWSYQTDGNIMDVTTPNELMLRLIYSPEESALTVKIMPYSDNTVNDDHAHSCQCYLYQPLNMAELALAVDTREPHRAYISLVGTDGYRLDINSTHEGLIADIWGGIELAGNVIDEDDEADLMASVAAAFTDFSEDE